MKIFSIALNSHDHNTYDGVHHKQLERFTRMKHNIPWHVDAYPEYSDASKMNPEDYRLIQKFYDDYYDKNNAEVLSFSFTKRAITLIDCNLPKEILDFKPKQLWDYYYKNNLYYIDHHQSHAVYAFLSSQYSESDILAIDGNGSNFSTIFIKSDGEIIDLSDKLSIGMLWNYFSKLLGFGYLGAGKVMGLAGYGKVDDGLYMIFDEMADFGWNDWGGRRLSKNFIGKYINLDNILPSTIAATLQAWTMDQIMHYVLPLKSSNNLCIAGGVAYNGYINEEFTKYYTNVYVPPACGDEGQALGNYMHADYILNDNIHIPKVYAGLEYEYIGNEKLNIRKIAQEIANGKIIGWFQGKSESGNRALGNRSILADPRNPKIKDIINKHIKKREDFRPFAPVVIEKYASNYFNINQPSPYMSRIVKVKDSMLSEIPGVIHVDGTARIQTVTETQNPKLYKLLMEFYQVTGYPILLNTSFNCREPIVETPKDALHTFEETDMDILVINNYVIKK